MSIKIMHKRQIFKVSMLLILGLSVFICIYALLNYNDSTVSTPNNIEHRMPPINARNQISGDGNQIHGKRFPDVNSPQHMAPQNGRIFGRNISSGFKYAPLLTTYSIIFLFLFIAA